LLALLCLVAVPRATAQPEPDPQEIAQRCIERANAMAAHRVQRNFAVAEECVAAIEELIEAGEIEAARRVARRCVHGIVVRSHHTVRHIQANCARCIHVLIFLGEPELAQAVGEACANAVGAVRESRHVAVQAILEALPGGAAANVYSPCPGDVDGDDRVGVADLAAMIGAFGTDADGAADLDGDGVVGATDLVELLLAWGPCP
jgi:hypothetical protein